MKAQERREQNLRFILEEHDYCLVHHLEFDYDILKYIEYHKRAGRGSNANYNDVIIMADTETSKPYPGAVGLENHVCAWTISMRAYGYNLVTLWGHKPSTMIETFKEIQAHLKGHDLIVYFHNLSYDYVFLRKFLFRAYGTPKKQLNTKSLYPIDIEFEDGLILKDSLILAQRSLDKWGKDLNVQHQKAVGFWDYEKVRSQKEEFTYEELKYIEHDTLCGVECIDAYMNNLKKSIYSLPYTATGVPRADLQKIGSENRARQAFPRYAFNFQQYQKGECTYHGGYTHGNRGLINWILNDVKCYDFASSYPFCLLAFLYPMERFTRMEDCKPEEMLQKSEEYAFMFKLVGYKVILKDWDYPMPALQLSKAVKVINPIVDNGRLLSADYIEIYLTELDLEVIYPMYNFKFVQCTDVEFAKKAPLPRWFTDYVYKCFVEKTQFKGGDPVLYAIAKSKLNSLYGLTVQKNVKVNILEDYETGEYYADESENKEELFEKYLGKRTSILPYQWGIYCTAYAFRNLYRLGACCETWVYSDTDSCYGINWDEDKVKVYNESCKRLLQERGYGAVNHNGRDYWLGVAELDKVCSEFKVLGAKRYCYRDAENGKLKITVAGVPKSGAAELHDDINNFQQGFIFHGSVNGKKQHTHLYSDAIHKDKYGNEIGDSIDLSPCDYKLDMIESISLDDILNEEEIASYYEYNEELLLQYNG